MLEKNNHGILTDLQLESNGCFKFLFMSIGACIRGFKSLCRLVICVDETFITIRCGGTMLCVMIQDTNAKIYPIAVSVVDSENNEL